MKKREFFCGVIVGLVISLLITSTINRRLGNSSSHPNELSDNQIISHSTAKVPVVDLSYLDVKKSSIPANSIQLQRKYLKRNSGDGHMDRIPLSHGKSLLLFQVLLYKYSHI